MLFLDTIKQEKFKVLFEGKTDHGDITKVRVKFAQADERNGNGRIYPLALWQREVNRIQDDINAGGVLGMSKHPKDAITDAGDVSHIVSKLELDDKGTGWAELKILDTTKGKNLKTVMKAGGRLAVSTRGFGTMDSDTGIVNDDYRLDNLDIVVNPSFKDGFFTQDNIFESMDLTRKKHLDKSSSGAFMKEGIVKKKLIEELNEDTQWSRVTKRLYEDEKDFKGTLEEYVELNGLKIKAVLAVEDGKYPDYEMAMIKLKGNEQDIADGKKMDVTPDKSAEPKDYYEESLITGIHPEKRAENVNKYRNKPAATDRRIALRRRVVLSNPSFSQEKIDEMTDKLLAGEKAICESSKKERLLLEAEDEKKKQKAKKDKRFNLKMEMIRQMKLGGFTETQINLAIERKMSQLDEEAN